MADEKWSGFDIEISTTGTLVTVLYPDGLSPTGYKNAVISITNFFSSLQSQITDNEDDIAILENDVAVLQNNSNKVIAKAQNADYTATQNADSLIDHIYFRYVSGTPTVKVGTTAGNDNIVSEQEVTDAYLNDISEYTETSRTLYISISSGSVDVVIMSKEDLFDIT